jgi:tetratricopeptide (TPR) repeat protein
MMKATVLSEKAVRQTLADWAPVYLDEAKEPELMRQFRIEAFPTFVILNANEMEEERFVGALSPQDFIKELTDFRKLSGRIASLEASATDAPSWKTVGDMYSELGNSDKAMEAYKKALALDPRGTTGVAADVEYLDATGAINKNREQAETRLAKLEQQYPKSPRAGQALYTRAVLALDEHKDEQARGLLRDYQRRYPTGKFNGRVGDLLNDLAAQAKEPQPAPAAKQAR